MATLAFFQFQCHFSRRFPVLFCGCHQYWWGILSGLVHISICHWKPRMPRESDPPRQPRLVRSLHRVRPPAAPCRPRQEQTRGLRTLPRPQVLRRHPFGCSHREWGRYQGGRWLPGLGKELLRLDDVGAFGRHHLVCVLGHLLAGQDRLGGVGAREKLWLCKILKHLVMIDLYNI